MSTAAIESPVETTSTTRRNGPAGRRTAASVARPELAQTRQHTEEAISDLITATTDAIRSFVPQAVLRPTEAVDYAFDLAEQTLAAARRVALELASVVESGLQGAERRAS